MLHATPHAPHPTLFRSIAPPAAPRQKRLAVHLGLCYDPKLEKLKKDTLPTAPTTINKNRTQIYLNANGCETTFS